MKKYKQIHTWKRYSIFHSDFFDGKMVGDPDSFMTGKVLKQDIATTVVAGKLGSQNIVIKRFNLRNLSYALRRMVSRSRAKTCWLAAQCLQDKVFLTAKPIAVIEKRFGPILLEYYYIYEYIDGVLALDYFTDENIDDSHFNDYARKLVSLIKRLFESGITHGDTKSANYVFKAGEPYIRDVDTVYEQKYISCFLHTQ